MPFLAVGVWGFKILFANKSEFSKPMFTFGLGLAVSMVLTCIGSAYFHWTPIPETLVWDRIPMTIGFASILAIVTADRIDEKLATIFFWSLLPLGILSIAGYALEWFSLRPYIFMQFGTIAFVLLSVIFLKPKKINNYIWWKCLGFYVAAKILEFTDVLIFNFGEVVSGHSLKHVFAAISVYIVMSLYKKESLVS